MRLNFFEIELCFSFFKTNKMSVKPIPKGYRTLTPYIMIEGAVKLIQFLEKAFNAKEVAKTMMPDGTVGNAEIKIGKSMVMIAEARSNWPAMPVQIYMYVKNVDKKYNKAIKAGAESIMKPANMFYGDRNAGVKDPSGNIWWIASRYENLSPKEIQKRSNELKG